MAREGNYMFQNEVTSFNVQLPNVVTAKLYNGRHELVSTTKLYIWST